jgi:hypothetical protein
MTRLDILKRRVDLGGPRGVTCADGGVYTCHECGETWRSSERWLWWPIRFRWGDPLSSMWFTWHGIQAHRPNARIEQRVNARVLHFGRLKVILGRYE